MTTLIKPICFAVANGEIPRVSAWLATRRRYLLTHTLRKNYDLVAVFAINASIALPQSLLN